MSLFVCEECGCIENTALSHFHMRDFDGDGRALCSGCDPAIGKWHGAFPQRPYDPESDKPAYMDSEWRDTDPPSNQSKENL